MCIYKTHLISTEGYKNAGVHYLKIRKTDELWVSMKNVGDGLGVKNISDLVLKEIFGIYEKKNEQKKKLTTIKRAKDKFLESLIT